MIVFKYVQLVAALLLYLCLAADSTHANLVFDVSFTPDSATFGGDIEGLIGSTITFSFTSDSGPTYVNAGNVSVSGPGVTASSAFISITGSSVGDNNGIFPTQDFPPNFLGGGGAFAIANDLGDTLFGSGNGANPAILLPSGNSLHLGIPAFGPAPPAVSIGDPISASDFAMGNANFAGVTVRAQNDALLFSDISTSSNLTVTTIPEPSAILYGGAIASLAIATHRGGLRRCRNMQAAK